MLSSALREDPQPARLHSILNRIGAAVPEVVELCDALDDVPLWVKSVSGHYQWVNRSFLHNFGLESRDEVVGLTDYDLCTSEFADKYRVDDERVFCGERILGRHELIGHFDHVARWCLTTKLPLHDLNGDVVGLAGLTRPLANQDPAASTEPLSRAIRLICEHPGENLSNQRLAQAACMSQRAFERNFRASYKCTPQQYIRRMRVRLSCRALENSQDSFADIAAEFGFSDQSHFSREFHRMMGVTPSRYRAQKRA